MAKREGHIGGQKPKQIIQNSSFWGISNMPVWVPLSITEENSNSCSPSKIDHAYQIFCQTPRHFAIIFWTEPIEYWLNSLFSLIFENDIGGNTLVVMLQNDPNLQTIFPLKFSP